MEGTPAASLVKDVNKFFAAKPPERMAGESVSQPRKIDPRAINTRRPTPAKSEVVLDTFMGRRAAEPEVVLDTFMGNRKKDPVSDQPTDSKKPVEDKRRFTGGSKDFNERTGRVEPSFRDSPQRKPNIPSNRSEARDKAESRRKNFFQRRRSRKEAVRSQREQEATQGKFITTLGR